MNKPIFLDDKLYAYYEKHIDGLPPYLEYIAAFIADLYGICDDYKDEHISPDMKLGEVYCMFNRIFRSWDLFVNKISDDKHIMKPLLIKASYERECLSNPEIKKVYEQAKIAYQNTSKFL